MILTLPLLVALSAGISALIGLLVLEHFFRDKLKDLFEDTNYFIFLFLVIGYVLYALGEVSYYLSVEVFHVNTPLGIQDLYWSFGGILILLSFFSLSLSQAKSIKKPFYLLIQLLFALIFFTIIFFTVIKNGSNIFNYFYPLISSLIVVFSFSAFLYAENLGRISSPLKVFFISSILILIGDIFFSYANIHASLVSANFLSDLFYFSGYILSALAFILFSSRIKGLVQS